MKRIFTFLAVLLLIGSVESNAQCTPDQTIDSSGLYPSEFLLPCLERGNLFDTVIQIKNFDTVNISGADITINWVRVDSLVGLPNGINWSCVTASADPNCQIQQSENACIRMTGTTNDPRGQYKMGIYLTASTSPLGLFEGVTADFFGFRYDLRVVDPGETCPNVDTTILQGVPFGFSAYTTGINELQNDLLNMMVYPSPIRYEDQAYISITSEQKHQVTGTVVDVAGKEVYTEEFDLRKGTTIRSFDAMNLAPGSYFYNVSNAYGTASVKFIKID